MALFWTPDVDLDLYVTDPKQETVYFANPKSGTGGKLDTDTGCPGASKVGGGRSEIVRWQHPTPGRYRVGVDFMDTCGSRTESVGFRVVVEVGGTRKEQVGKVTRNIFEPVIVEFDVPGETEDGRAASQKKEGS